MEAGETKDLGTVDLKREPVGRPIELDPLAHTAPSAWRNRSYSLYDRVTANGNTYECTTPGTSTAAPSGTNPEPDTINPGGTAKWRHVGPGAVAAPAFVALKGDVMAWSTPAVSSSSSATMAVVAVTGWLADTSAYPTTVSGCGLEWTKQRGDYATSQQPNLLGAEVWTAPISGALSSCSVTITPRSSGADAHGIGALYVLDNAATEIGVSGGRAGNAGTPTSNTIDLSGVSGGSWIIFATMDVFDPVGSLIVPVAGSVFDVDQSAKTEGILGEVSGHAIAGGAGSYSVGATSNDTLSAVSAVEIKQAR